MHDADAVQCTLNMPGEAVPGDQAALSPAPSGRQSRRNRLAALVLDNPAALKGWRAIVHPLGAGGRATSSRGANARGRRSPCSISLSCSRPVATGGWTPLSRGVGAGGAAAIPGPPAARR